MEHRDCSTTQGQGVSPQPEGTREERGVELASPPDYPAPALALGEHRVRKSGHTDPEEGKWLPKEWQVGGKTVCFAGLQCD